MFILSHLVLAILLHKVESTKPKTIRKFEKFACTTCIELVFFLEILVYHTRKWKILWVFNECRYRVAGNSIKNSFSKLICILIRIRSLIGES